MTRRESPCNPGPCCVPQGFGRQQRCHPVVKPSITRGNSDPHSGAEQFGVTAAHDRAVESLESREGTNGDDRQSSHSSSCTAVADGHKIPRQDLQEQQLACLL